MNRWMIVATIAVVLLRPAAAPAQGERFELGQRMRAFESAWEDYPDPICRIRAAPDLKRIVFISFSLQPGEAAKALDQARFALRSTVQPPAETLWAESLTIRPECRFIDATDRSMALTVASLYKVDTPVPSGARVRLVLRQTDGKVLGEFEAGLTALPWQGKVPLAGLPEGDHILRTEVRVGGIVLASREMTFSCAVNQPKRLAALFQAVEGLDRNPLRTEKESLRSLCQILEGLSRKQVLETNYPAARLLAESEQVLALLGGRESYWCGKRPGEYWLSLAAGKTVVPARLMVPAAAAKGGPLPLVVAVHGASGSENLFFDGYGRGGIVRMCQERGWLLVAPRLAFGGTIPVDEIVEEAARLYAVDRQRVFLVGHSMGAAQCVRAAGQAPDRFAAVAALGGGGLLRPSDGLKPLPFFVGVGTEDFALSWSRNLNDSLKKAGVQKVLFREYEGIEHVAICHAALADVFAWLDEIARRGK